MKRNFEFVTRGEYTPVRELFESIICDLQKELKGVVTFQFQLIGSGRRKLVTREAGSNKGFDFDYNLNIQKDLKKNDINLRLKIFEALQRLKRQYCIDRLSQGKHAITIKYIDKENSRIVYSCDLAVVRDRMTKKSGLVQEILLYDKESSRYSWKTRENSENHFEKLVDIEAGALWLELREEYLKLKNNDHQGKESYQLFIEAINNIYNKFYGE